MGGPLSDPFESLSGATPQDYQLTKSAKFGASGTLMNRPGRTTSAFLGGERRGGRLNVTTFGATGIALNGGGIGDETGVLASEDQNGENSNYHSNFLHSTTTQLV